MPTFYHDEDYDGLVLKLPSFVLTANNFESILEKLRQDLETAKYSAFHPDFQKSLNELENWQSKSKDVLAKRKLETELKETYRKEEEQKVERLLNCEYYELEWVDDTLVFDPEHLKGYEFEDIFTPKLSIKKSFRDSINEKLKTFEDWKEFAQSSLYGLVIKLSKLRADMCVLDANNFYTYSQGVNLGFKLPRLYVKLYFRGKRKQDLLKYRRAPLEIDKDGKLYIDYRGYDLTNFKIDGLKLIKIEENEQFNK